MEGSVHMRAKKLGNRGFSSKGKKLGNRGSIRVKNNKENTKCERVDTGRERQCRTVGSLNLRLETRERVIKKTRSVGGSIRVTRDDVGLPLGFVRVHNLFEDFPNQASQHSRDTRRILCKWHKGN